MPVKKPELINVPEIDDNAKQAFLSRVEGSLADRLSKAIDKYNTMFGTNDTISFSVMQYNRLKGEIDTVILPIVRSNKTVNESALTKLEEALKECKKIISNPNPENKATAVQFRFNQSGMDKEPPAPPSEKAPRKFSMTGPFKTITSATSTKTLLSSEQHKLENRNPVGKIQQTDSGSSGSTVGSLQSDPLSSPKGKPALPAAPKPTRQQSQDAAKRASHPRKGV